MILIATEKYNQNCCYALPLFKRLRQPANRRLLPEMSKGTHREHQYRRGNLAVYLHGFGKNSQDNLDDGELEALKAAADVIFRLDAAMIEKAAADGKWKELSCNA
jgi:hypothetical protein